MIPAIDYGVVRGWNRSDVALARARAVCGEATMNAVIEMEFGASTEYEAALGATPLISESGGWVEVVNAGAGTVGAMEPANQGHTLAWIKSPRNEKWYARAWMAMESTTAVTGQMTFDLRDNGGGISPMFRIGSVGPGAGGVGNFSAQIFDDAGVNIFNHDTGVPFDQLKHLWEMWSDLVNVFFAIDGVVVGTFAVGTVGVNPVRPEIVTFDSASATIRKAIADYVRVCVVGGP